MVHAFLHRAGRYAVRTMRSCGQGCSFDRSLFALALLMQATGFPIAKMAAKLAVGYTLDQVRWRGGVLGLLRVG